MKSTEILIKEHKVILQALSHLFSAKERLEKDERPPVEFFRMAIDFFQNFADVYHHFKEEYLMFGLLAGKKGASWIWKSVCFVMSMTGAETILLK
jgi:hemerythrin-like domain-containing protein